MKASFCWLPPLTKHHAHLIQGTAPGTCKRAMHGAPLFAFKKHTGEWRLWREKWTNSEKWVWWTSSFEWSGTGVSTWLFLSRKLYPKALELELSCDERETVALSAGKLEGVAWTPRTGGQGHVKHIKGTSVSHGWSALSFWVLTCWRW